MNEKLKKALISTALERGEIRSRLELWQYLPVIENLCESLKSHPDKRDTLLMALLEEIAFDAWRQGKHDGAVTTYEASKKKKGS